jgi:hypothetical protein
MITTVKNAAAIAKKITDLYNKLNLDCEYFFKAHHDNLRIQMDCAWEVVGEIDHYLKVNDLESANDEFKSLEDTLIYCDAVIKLQEQTNNLPKCIFG